MRINKSVKRIISLVLIAVMLLSLAACGGSKTQAQKPQQSPQTPQQSELQLIPAENSTKPEKTEEKETNQPQAPPAEAEKPAETLIEIPAEKPAEAPAETPEEAPRTEEPYKLDENGYYYSKDEVAKYIHDYGKLPGNFITKKEAQNLGWEGGSLKGYADGMVIGGDRFGNYEGLLPKKKGRTYTECDIDTLNKKRGAKRIIFSNDGLIYYTDDHYESFTLLYGEE